ncbi:MAG: IPT/TIG domain-containing protein [Candidatus Firestonebacteria bacterium]
MKNRLISILILMLIPLYLKGADIATTTTDSSYANPNDRKLVITSDGKLVAFYYVASTGVYYSISSDAGATWSSATLIGGGSATSRFYSVWKDSSDKIYIVYKHSEGTYKVKLRSMTYSGGSYSFTGAETTLVTSTGDFSNVCSVAKVPATGRIWVSYVANTGTTPATTQLHTTYSDDEGATWHGDTAGNSAVPDHYVIISGSANHSSLVIYNGNPAIFFGGSYTRWSYFDGTVWSAYATIISLSVYNNFSVCVTDNNYIHLAYSDNGTSVKHTYYNGLSWLGAVNTLQGTVSTNPALTTDGVNLWCFWSSSNTGAADIVYKKYNGTSWDDSATTLYSSGGNNYKSAAPYSIGGNNTVVPVFWYEGSISPWTIRFSKIVFSPKVTEVSPLTGDNSAVKTVTITGQGFFGEAYSNNVTSIKLDDTANTELNISSAAVSDLTISNAVIPSGVKVGTYNVKVTTSKGTNTTSTQKFVVTTSVIPTVVNIEPSVAGATGTTEITIYGTGFFGGTSSFPDVTDIRLSDGGNTQVSVGTVVSDTQINNCVVPSGVALGSYDVKVYNGGGNNTTSSVKLGVTSNPIVTALSTTTAANTQATTLSITGAGFFGGGSSSDVEWVRISGGGYLKSLTTYSVAEDTSITEAVLTSASHAGTYDVQVRTYSGGNNSTSTQKFVVTTAVVPQVTGLNPSSGNNFFVSSTLNIYGSGFYGGTGEDDVRDIRLSDGSNTAITKGTVSSDTSIINCTVPSGVAIGTYDVKVTTGGGIGTSSVGYIVTSMPAVTGVTPNTGLNTTQVTGVVVTGSNFTGVTVMGLSGPQEIPLYVYTPVDDTSISGVMISAFILAGTYDVKITTSSGTNTTSAVKWIATAALPSVSSILPDKGSTATAVTITGAGFYGGTLTTGNVTRIRMYKDTTETLLGSYSVISDTILQATIPSGLPVNTYDVKVTNGGGESTGSVKFAVTAPLPVITQITPDSGLRDSNITIQITGSGFFSGTTSSAILSVKMGNTDISYSPDFDTVIQAVVPSGLDADRYPLYISTSAGTNTIYKNYDVLFDNTQIYEFSRNDLVFNIPANTFSAPAAIMINTVVSDTTAVQIADKIKYRKIKIRNDLSGTLRELTTSTGENIPGGKSIGLRYGYGSSNINDSVIEKLLRVITLGNDGRWDFVSEDQQVDLSAKEIVCNLTHLSVFKAGQFIEASGNLANVVVYPNPMDFSAGTGIIKFVNLTWDPSLRIYTMSGELVKEIAPNAFGNAGNDGRIEWDGKNEKGEVIARGLYIYMITDAEGGRKTGKLVVK